MRTTVKVINNQEYICQLTNDIDVNDFIILTHNPIDRPIETTINQIIFANKSANQFQYKKISNEGSHDFGWNTYKSMVNFGEYIGKEYYIETETLYHKIIGIGNEINN